MSRPPRVDPFTAATNFIRNEDLSALTNHLRSHPDLITATNDGNESLVHQAAASGNKEILQYLIHMGGDPARSSWGMTPLDYAIWNDQLETTEALVGSGAIPSDATLIVAQRKANNNILKTLSNKALFDLISPSNSQPLEQAIHCWFNGDFDDLKEIVGKRRLEKLEYRHDQTLLHRAAMQGNVDVIETLIAAGFDMNQCDVHGNTAIYYAFVFNRLEAVAALTRLGAKPEGLPNLTETWHHSRIHQEGTDVSDGAIKGVLTASHEPNPCNKNQCMIYTTPPAEFTWFYRTILSNSHNADLRIIWFDSFALFDGRWYPGNVKNRPLGSGDFSMWYGDEQLSQRWNGIIEQGSSARCEINWHCSDHADCGLHKWAYRATDDNGKHYYAEAVLESVPIN